MAQANGKVVVPVETLEEVKARLEGGSVKRAIFDALEAVGQEGLTIASLVEAVQVGILHTGGRGAPFFADVC